MSPGTYIKSTLASDEEKLTKERHCLPSQCPIPELKIDGMQFLHPWMRFIRWSIELVRTDICNERLTYVFFFDNALWRTFAQLMKKAFYCFWPLGSIYWWTVIQESGLNRFPWWSKGVDSWGYAGFLIILWYSIVARSVQPQRNLHDAVL